MEDAICIKSVRAVCPRLKTEGRRSSGVSRAKTSMAPAPFNSTTVQPDQDHLFAAKPNRPRIRPPCCAVWSWQRHAMRCFQSRRQRFGLPFVGRDRCDLPYIHFRKCYGSDCERPCVPKRCFCCQFNHVPVPPLDQRKSDRKSPPWFRCFVCDPPSLVFHRCDRARPVQSLALLSVPELVKTPQRLGSLD
jgi:hypothetical protein